MLIMLLMIRAIQTRSNEHLTIFTSSESYKVVPDYKFNILSCN